MGPERTGGSPHTAGRIRLATGSELGLLDEIERSGDALFVAAGHPEFGGADTIIDAEGAQAVADDRLWVYEADGEVAGFVLMGELGEELSVKQISVRPDLGRRGIGTALMRHVLGETAAPTMVLDTQADIAWNAPWYQQLGFEVVPPELWTEAMRQLAEAQTAAGFDWSTRVHMRWRR